jgi:ligand-binding SRPBCC domain-containing protein
MPALTIITDVRAPIGDCFDLARDIGFHVRSLEQTKERVVAGRADGLIELGETVTWEANHLGMTRRMTVKISTMDRPTHFRDEQTDGPFKAFVHDHFFEDLGDGVTRMTDQINFASPFGLLGHAIDRIVMRKYLQKLIRQRVFTIKTFLESAF